MINKERNKLQKEALDALRSNNFNGFVLMATGSGKSWVLIQALKELNPGSCLYLCESKINRDTTFKNELIKWGAKKYIPRIDFMCYQTAHRLHGLKYDVVICDEADYMCTEKYINSVLNNKFGHKILTSATLSKDKRKLATQVAPIVYEKGLHDIEGEGVVNESKYFIVKYLLNANENHKYLGFNSSFVKLMNTHPVNHKRLEDTQIFRRLFLSTLSSSADACKKLLTKLYKDEHRKILVFCGVSEQADRVCKYSYHSINDNVDAFKAFDKGDIRVLSVVGKVDRGINIDGVNTVIFEAPPKSNTKQQQKSGRGRRLDVDDVLEIYFLIPYYIDKYGKVKPTIVDKYVKESLGKLKVDFTVYDLKDL